MTDTASPGQASRRANLGLLVAILLLLTLRCPDKIGQSRIKQPEQFSNTSC